MSAGQGEFRETWAEAARLCAAHHRDYFIEAIRELQRKRDAEIDPKRKVVASMESRSRKS